jgi:putative FmdB family regulatory protein
MPLYTFHCDKCEREWDELQMMQQEHTANCPECGGKARQVFTPFAFTFDFTPGYDPGLGKWVDTKREREDIIARKGLRRVRS